MSTIQLNSKDFASQTSSAEPVIASTVTGGGINNASRWHVNADTAGDISPVTAIEETRTPTGFGVLGSSMTIDTGIFTFPATGYWLLMLNWTLSQPSGSDRQTFAQIHTTHNDSTYAQAAGARDNVGRVDTSGANYSNISCQYIFDVVDTANYKCKIIVDNVQGSTVTLANESTITFIKLANT